MKPRRNLFLGSFLVAFSMACSAHAADYTWNGATNGTWNTTGTNWLGASGTPWDSTNGVNNTATFDLASLAATISGTIFTNGITFVRGGSLSGGTITLAGTSPGISVASSQTATISSIIAGSAGLTKTGSGALILSGLNTYTAGTTLGTNAGTIISNFSATQNGLSSGAVAIGSGSTVQINNLYTDNATRIISNTFTGAGTLRLNFAAGTTGRNTTMAGVAGFTGTIRLSNSGATGDKWNLNNLGTINASVIVDSGNTLYTSAGTSAFSGGVTISGTGNNEGLGAVRLGSSSTLGGRVLLADNATIRGENATTSILSANVMSGAAGTQTLTFNNTLTASGNIGGGFGTLALTKDGSGTATLSGNNFYTGATNVTNGGTLSVTGSIRQGTTLYVGTGAATTTFTSSGTSIFSGAVATENGVANLRLIRVTAGSFGAGSLSLGRGGAQYDSEPPGGDDASGFYMSGGLANVTGAMNLSVGTANNSSASARLDAGSTLNVGGVVTIGLNNTGRWSAFDVNGGNFTSSNTATGVQLGSASAGNVKFMVRGGTADVQKFTFNGVGSTAYNGIISVSGGALYIGSGGIVTSANASYTQRLVLAGGTLGATADWSSSVITNLTANSTIRAADAVGTARNISLSSAVGQSGGTFGITKTGAGTLTLSGANTYTGTTTVSGGTLQIGNGTTGSLNGTTGTALTFGGTGAINFKEAAGSSQGMGVLTFSGGDGTVQSTYGGSGNTTLTFSNVLAPSAGATGNFLTSSGTNGTTNKIVLTQYATATTPTGTLLSNSLFYNGSAYATYDTGGFVRDYKSGDTGYLAAPTGANLPTGSVSTSNLDLTTGNINGQNADRSANTLNLRNYSLIFDATSRTLSVNGILSSGAIDAQIANGTAASKIQATAAGNGIVVRVNGSSDMLTIAPFIQNFGGGTTASALTKAGEGTLVLSNTANTYTGKTFINGGVLQIANADTALGTAPAAAVADQLTINGGTLRFTGNTSLATNRGVTLGAAGGTFDTQANTPTIGGIIAGSGSLTKIGSGSLTLTSTGNYTGATVIKAGTLVAGTTNTVTGISSTTQVFLGDTSGSANTTLQLGTANSTNFSNNVRVQSGNSAVLALNGSGNINLSGSVILGSSNASGKSLTIANVGTDTAWIYDLQGVIQDPAGMTAGTAGTVTIGSTGVGTVRFSGANTYTGDTRLAANNFQIYNANALQNSTLDLATGDAGTVSAINQNSTLGGLKGSRNLNMAGRTLSIGNNNQDTTYSGILSNGALMKVGSGTLTLSGANSYSGGTTVSQGTLKLDFGSRASNPNIGSFAVTAGAVLNMDNTNTTAGSFYPTGFVLSGGGTVTKTNTGSIDWQNSTDLRGFTGTIDVQGGAIRLNNLATGYAYMPQATLNIGIGALFDLRYANTDLTVTVDKFTGSGTFDHSYSRVGVYNLTVGANDGSSQFDGVIQNSISSQPISFTKTGTGTQTLSGTNTYTGATLISAGTLQLGNNSTTGSLSPSSAIANNGTLVFNRTNTVTQGTDFANGISGTGGVTKLSTGTLILSGVNTYEGNTLFGTAAGTSTGILRLANSSALGAGKLIINNGNADTGTVELTGGINLANNIDFFGRSASTTAAIIRNVSGDNELSGVLSGSFNGGHYNLHSDAGTLTISNKITSSTTSTRLVNLRGVGAINVSGLIENGSASVGVQALDAGTYTLGGNNTFTGGVTINAGTLRINNAGALNSTAGSENAVAFGPSSTGVLQLNGNSVIIKSLDSNATPGTPIVENANGTPVVLTIGNSGNASSTYAGILQNGTGGGTLALVKAGGGILTLSGTNTYSGGTTITAGTLALGNNVAAAGVGGIFIGASTGSSTATLQASNGLTFANAITVQGSGGTKSITSTTSSATQTYSGGVTLNDNLTLNNNGGTSGITFTTNAFALNGNTLTVNSNTSNAGTVTFGSSITGTSASAINFGGSTTTTGKFRLGAANPSFLGTATLNPSSAAGAIALELNNVNALQNATLDTGASGNQAVTFVVTGTNTYNIGALQGTDDLAIGANTLSIGTKAVDTTYAGVISGTNGKLTKVGGNKLTLSNTNTFDGLTTISNGMLELGHGTDTLNGAVTVSGGTLAIGGNSDSVGAVTLTSGNITGTGGTLTGTSYALQGGVVTANLGTGNVTVTSGTTTLNGTSASTSVAINSGNLTLGASDRLANGATVTVAGGILDTTASNYTDTVAAFNMSSGSLNGGGTITASTYGLMGGTVTGNLGTGTLNSSGTVALNGTAGATAVNVTAGTLTLGSANRLTGTPTLSLSGGQLTLAGAENVASYQQTGGTLAGPGFTLTSAAAYDMQAGTVSANLGGSGIALNKTTTGTVTLSGSNSYSGLTTVSGGILLVGNNAGLGTTAGDTTVTNSAAALVLANGVTVTGETILIAGTAGTAGTGANFNGALQAAPSATAEWAGTVKINSTDARVGAGTSGTLKISGAIVDAAGTVLNIGAGSGGVGTVIVSAAAGTNTYSGSTTITRGTLKLGADNTLPAGTILDVDVANTSDNSIFDLGGFNQTVAGLQRTGAGSGTGGSFITNSGAADKTLTINQAGTSSYSGVIQDGTTNKTIIVKSGAGMLTLSGATANTFTGLTTVSAGTLELNKSANVNAVGGNVTVSGGTLRWLANEQMSDATTTALVLNSGTVDLNGKTETLGTFTNNNGAFSTGVNGQLIGTGETVTWAGGTNTINSGGSVKDKHVVITGGTNTVQAGGTLELQTGGGTSGLIFGGTSSPTITLDSVASGTAGRILLEQDVTVNGTLTSGTAQILNGGSAANSGFINMNGGTRTFTVNNGSAATDMLVSAVITNGGLTKDGAGTLALSGANAYTGSTTITAGTLQLGNGGTTGSLATSSAITNNGTLAFNRSDTMTQGTDFGTITSGTGAVVQNGSGTVVLNAANSYSGTTTVNAGVLVIGSGGSLANTAVTVGGVAASGAPTLAGVGTIGGNTVISSASGGAAGKHSPGLAGVGTQTFSGDLTYGSGSIFEWDLNDNSTSIGYDKVSGGGTLTVDSGAIFKIVLGSGVTADPFWTNPGVPRIWSDIFSGFASLVGSFSTSNIELSGPGVANIGMGNFSISGTTLTWTAVPEPTSALVGLLIGAGLLRRRRMAAHELPVKRLDHEGSGYRRSGCAR